MTVYGEDCPSWWVHSSMVVHCGLAAGHLERQQPHAAELGHRLPLVTWTAEQGMTREEAEAAVARHRWVGPHPPPAVDGLESPGAYGAWLAGARRRVDWTVAQLAHAVGVTPDRVATIEAGGGCDATLRSLLERALNRSAAGDE